MQEELFTLKELQQIIKEAEKPIYSEPNLLHLGSNKTSIIRVSKENGLTLVYGNEWTGYKHIIERHSLTSRKPYWDDNNKIGNPSKFQLNLAPVEYLNVAAKIFKPENIDNLKNKNTRVFNLFIGRYKHYDGTEVEYTLLTYKDTKIVHTFYVSDNKKPFNKKKTLDLRQGWVTASEDYMNCIQTYEIPYYDHQNIQRFKVIVRCLEIERKEKWYIQVNSIEGYPILTRFIRDDLSKNKTSMPFKMIQMDFVDITWVEKIIKQIIDNKLHY